MPDKNDKKKKGKTKQILFISNTYFQLITILQLYQIEYNHDEIDMIISDHSANSNAIVDNMKSIDGIRNVFKVSSKLLSMPKSKSQFIRAFFDLLLFRRTLKKMVPGLSRHYDLILFHNLDSFTYLVYYNYRDKCKYKRFEEGYNIYIDSNGRRKTVFLNEKVFGNLLGRGSLDKRVESIWLYHPELLTYNIHYPVEKIKIISKDDIILRNILNKAFEYKNPNLENVRFIIFEESFFADGIPVQDEKLFINIISILGKENVAIKLHPRNNKNRFESVVKKRFEQQFVPWELIQMNNDFRNKVFITISTGSVLASALYFNESIPTIFCYKAIGHKVSPNYEYYIDKLVKTKKNIKFYVPETMDDLKVLLNKFAETIRKD